jgi:hypothetical protein
MDMKFKEIVSVSTLSGLRRIVAQRTDGLIISELDGTGKKFLSSRKFIFTPLESIAIYTQEDSVPLLDVFITMKEKESEIALPESNASGEAYFSYLEKILPDYDKDKVYLTDVKKLVKWFALIKPFDILKKEEAVEETPVEQPQSEASEESAAE